jgi:hypothetical protein
MAPSFRPTFVATIFVSLSGCESQGATPESIGSSALAAGSAHVLDSVLPSSAPPSSAATSASAPPRSATVTPAKVDIGGTIDARKVTFSSGYAKLQRGALQVVLTDQPIACFAQPAKGTTTLKLAIPPSSDGRFFAGSTFGVPFDVESPFSYYGASASMIAVDGASLAPDGRLSFTAVFASKSSASASSVDLAGSASLPICIAPGEAPLTMQKPNGTQLKIKSALAYRDPAGAAGSVEEIWLFTDLPATCGASRKPNRFTFVDLADIGQPALKGMRAAGPRPIRPLVHAPAPDGFMSGGSADPFGYGEIVWDAYDEKSSKLRGRVELWSFTGEAGSSTAFEATRCP